MLRILCISVFTIVTIFYSNGMNRRGKKKKKATHLNINNLTHVPNTGTQNTKSQIIENENEEEKLSRSNIFTSMFSHYIDDSWLNNASLPTSEVMYKKVYENVNKISEISGKVITFCCNDVKDLLNGTNQNGMFINKIDDGNGNFLLFDDFTCGKQLCLLKNCVVKAFNKENNCKKLSFIEELLFDFSKNIFYERGYYFKSSMDSWCYGYKSDKGHAYQISPFGFGKSNILFNGKDNIGLKKINISGDNFYKLFEFIESLLKERYLLKYYNVYEEVEDLLNNSVSDLLMSIDNIFKFLIDGKFLDNEKYEGIKNFVKLHSKTYFGDNENSHPYFKFCKYLMMLKLECKILFDDKKCVNNENKIYVNNKNKIYEFLLSIIDKYFYTVRLTCFDTGTGSLNCNISSIKPSNNIRCLDKEVDDSCKDEFNKHVYNYFNNVDCGSNKKPFYEYIFFFHKYDSFSIDFFKIEGDSLIFTEKNRRLKSSELCFILDPYIIKEGLDVSMIEKTDILRADSSHLKGLNLFLYNMGINKKKNISCLSLTNERFKFTYSCNNLLRQYDFWLDDKNRNVLSLFYNYSFNSFYEKNSFAYFEHKVSENKFSSVFSLFSNKEYLYFDLYDQKEPIISMKNGMGIFICGKLNKDVLLKSGNKYSFDWEIIYLIYCELNYFYKFYDMILKNRPYFIVFPDECFFDSNNCNNYLVYKKIGNENVGIINKDLNGELEFKEVAINKETLNFKLIYDFSNCNFRIVSALNCNKEISLDYILGILGVDRVQAIFDDVSGLFDSNNILKIVVFLDGFFKKKTKKLMGENLKSFNYSFEKRKMNNRKIIDELKSSSNCITKLELGKIIKNEDFISFVTKNAKIRVEKVKKDTCKTDDKNDETVPLDLNSILGDIDNLKKEKPHRFTSERDIKFVDYLISESKVKVDESNFLDNKEKFSILDQGTFSEQLSRQDYYNLILLVKGYIPQSNEYLQNNLSGIYHLYSDNWRRVYCTICDPTVSVFILIGHLNWKEKMARKKLNI